MLYKYFFCGSISLSLKRKGYQYFVCLCLVTVLPLPLCLLLCCGRAAVVLLFAVVAPGACWSHAGAMHHRTHGTAGRGHVSRGALLLRTGTGRGSLILLPSITTTEACVTWRQKCGDLKHSLVSHYPFILGSLEFPAPVSCNVDIRYFHILWNRPLIRCSGVPNFCA